MTTPQKALIIATMIVASLATLLVLQNRDNNRLRAELVTLREHASDTIDASTTVVQMSAAQEADRTRQQAERSELLRLRGQVALLRSQLRNYASHDNARNDRNALKTTPDFQGDKAPVVSAAFVARVPEGQTLISGGWISKPGKRIFMLSTPTGLPNENSVNIQSRLVEVSETIWNQLGWEELRKDSTQELQGLLDGPQTAQLLKSLEETKGVDLVTAPRITTANGREAQIVIGSGNDDDDKLRIGVIPTQSPDGRSFDLSLSLHVPHSAADAPLRPATP